MLKILLSYSRPHFDPGQKPESNPLWGSSASMLARTFHRLLSELGDLTYIDYMDPADLEKVRGRRFDLFLGIQGTFADVAQACDCARKVLIAVNHHPLDSARMVGGYAGLAALRWDRAVAFARRRRRGPEAALAHADDILCFGNDSAVETYVRRGFPRRRIRRMNYGLDAPLEPKPADLRPAHPARLVFSADTFYPRKGIKLVEELAGSALDDGLDFELDIVGRADGPECQSRLDALAARSSGKIRLQGWLNAGGPAYRALLERADFLLFPSLEEGQAGSVLDAISRGVVPLISRHCGFDFAPLGFLEARKGSAADRRLLRRAVGTGPEELLRLRQATLDYYAGHHAGFEDVLRRALGRIARGGSLYPKLSVILPVFNKEKSLPGLLRHLDAACAAYPDTELRVIFDGCRDGSEAVGRRFLGAPRAYETAFEVTPNIFEVKSNNLGLRQAKGEICAIVQDDNYVYDRLAFYEAVDRLELEPRLAVLGGLAGVNFYPLGTRLAGPGQIAMDENEVYWRQDAATDPALKDRCFEVDACMRGPLFIKKAFLEKEGYLDEDYAPLYMDDMDLCFRAWERGWRVACTLMDVENRSLTMARYDEAGKRFFEAVIRKNTRLFYERHHPGADKSHLAWLHRSHRAESDVLAGLGKKLRGLKENLRVRKNLFRHKLGALRRGVLGKI